MKKLYLLFLIACSLFTSSHAFDSHDYQRLMEGETNLRSANLENAVIKNINLNDVDFSDTNLQGAQFTDVILTKIRFDKTNLQNASFENVALINSQILPGTKLQGTSFKNVTCDILNIKNLTLSLKEPHYSEVLQDFQELLEKQNSKFKYIAAGGIIITLLAILYFVKKMSNEVSNYLWIIDSRLEIGNTTLPGLTGRRPFMILPDRERNWGE